jgi:hypothetical protein
MRRGEWAMIGALFLVAFVVAALQPGSWTHAILTGQHCGLTFSRWGPPPVCTPNAGGEADPSRP